MSEIEREAFEKWYTVNAFDYESNPVGSRECFLQWQAWQARAQAAQPASGVPEWISVEERLPEEGVPVFCYRPMAPESGDSPLKVSENQGFYHASLQGKLHKFRCWCHVTHWMPLPPHPQNGGPSDE